MKKDNKLPLKIFPLLPLRDTVLFPKTVVPLMVKDDESKKLVDDIMQGDRRVMISMTKNNNDKAKPNDFHRKGTVGQVIKSSKNNEGYIIMVQGLYRAHIKRIHTTSPYYHSSVAKLKDVQYKGKKILAHANNIRNLFQDLMDNSSSFPEEMTSIFHNISDYGQLADIICSVLNIDGLKKQELLETANIKTRLEKLTIFLNEELELSKMGRKIQKQVEKGMDKTQREYYLREQLKAIQKELGMDHREPDEISEMRSKLTAKNLPDHAHKAAEKEIDRLSKMNSSSSEYTVTINYIDWLLSLPWLEQTFDKMDIKEAEKTLNKYHHGLEKVKTRILEYLSVRKLNPDHKGPIICLVGPPGTGKTSLGRSIAEAMGRNFVRISLGGARDEAEIRGHRRTYVGALPGRIMQGLKKAGTSNPIFLLDEIDKIGSDFRGDPSSALLEVLDPEQNFSFSDHYIEQEYDLSKVIFITTANQLDSIPAPLLDRMEIIELPGYTEEEKTAIAKKFLLPRQLKDHGLTAKVVSFRKPAVRKIIQEYTHEAGVRNLEREIGTVCRGLARQIAEGKKGRFIISPDEVKIYLGLPKFSFDMKERTSVPGVATGMAWTPAGGDILFVEATMMPGQKSLVLTGQLGDVMKESAQAALSYLRSKAGTLGIPDDFYSDHDLHIHVPAGAIPKDGPSAGVTMLTALASLLTCRPIKTNLAMTGEVTLRGSVLPVGGIKEKVLAASRSGIKHIIIPEKNKYELEEIPKQIKGKLEFHLVNKMEEVLDLALDKPVGASCN